MLLLVCVHGISPHLRPVFLLYTWLVGWFVTSNHLTVEEPERKRKTPTQREGGDIQYVSLSKPGRPATHSPPPSSSPTAFIIVIVSFSFPVAQYHSHVLHLQLKLPHRSQFKPLSHPPTTANPGERILSFPFFLLHCIAQRYWWFGLWSSSGSSIHDEASQVRGFRVETTTTKPPKRTK